MSCYIVRVFLKFYGYYECYLPQNLSYSFYYIRSNIGAAFEGYFLLLTWLNDKVYNPHDAIVCLEWVLKPVSSER